MKEPKYRVPSIKPDDPLLRWLSRIHPIGAFMPFVAMFVRDRLGVLDRVVWFIVVMLMALFPLLTVILIFRIKPVQWWKMLILVGIYAVGIYFLDS